MSKFKAGDLALIIRSNISENLGKVVELVRATDEKVITLVDEMEVRNPERLKCWEVVGEGMVVTSKARPQGFVTARGAIAEKCLMPLRGDFQPEQELNRELAQ